MNSITSILGFANATVFTPVKYGSGTPRERFVRNAKAQLDLLVSDKGDKNSWFQARGNGFKVSLRNGFKNLVLDGASGTSILVNTKDEAVAFMTAAISHAEGGALDEILTTTAPKVGKKKGA